ncbi:type I polyketide synthase [Cochlodiniinecator piscidefendens]|uniref:type I polyketide synthase n=1 Tax=Cochlodiniinecator piscidefendens TaxID=2715756 RepID=UPI0014086085|nr:type I polyketide synthase [Cochlodiniinecator piscidefendens]
MNDGSGHIQMSENDIAIVGMAAHLPGADTLERYWSNLRDGVESIRQMSDEELLAAGEKPGRLHHKNYVRAAAPLDRFEYFDADFFGFSPKEAAILDPQHRQFLEVTWEALENAGHVPEKFDGPIGVFAGCGMGSYLYFNICSNPDLVDDVGMFLLRHTGNDKDFLATRVSHVFDLKGPSINMQTACSTSLVATHYACQALLNGECDMALAGGVTIELPQNRGYIFKEGEVLSPDGHCHAFDHRAEGTVFGSGAGAIVLRRLDDAINDGDHIWGVIKGTAVNNDGAAKAGYLAPSVDGQANAISEAHAIAQIPADTIDYVECHGTGTYLGDPIEVAALTEAFRKTTDETGFCGIGSVKTNIGHLDTAAGVASLIKTSLSLTHKQIPPSLGYEAPNPVIDFDGSPFSVNASLRDWTSHKGPRRAGVNSLGVGGTNAHAVLEEAPLRSASDESDWPFHILTLSARSKGALDDASTALAKHLRAHSDQPLADVAYTLKEGRRAFEKRRIVVAETHEEAARLLEENDKRRVFTHSALGDDPETIFMFPGGGAQYVGMARDLYETEPVFQDWMDRGFAVLEPQIDYDIRALWLADGDARSTADIKLKQPSVQLPLIMIVEYALAQLWMSWGVKPAALVGHSMGENTAACLAGVLSFEDCIGLVLLRGQLFDTVPAGGMLSVPLSLQDLEPYLSQDLDIAGLNAPDLTVVSGPQHALDTLAQILDEDDVIAQRIPIDIAAHSRMLDPILDRFRDYLRSIRLNAPQIPFVSNQTGDFITADEATNPDYWVRHLRGTVHFADCITTLSEKTDRVYLEMGPGKALSSLTQMHSAVTAQQVFSVLRHPDEAIEDDLYFLGIVGRLWATGVEADWEQIWGDAKRHRVPLPTYAFQRAPYFIEPGTAKETVVDDYLSRTDEIADWGYRPHWRPRLAEADVDPETELDMADPQSWLIFMDDAGVGAALAKRLRAAGHPVIEIHAGDAFGQIDETSYVLPPERGREGYDQLLQALVANGTVPTRIVHLWLLTDRETFRPGSSFFHRNIEQGFFSLLFLAQAIEGENLPKPLHITAVTSGARQVKNEPLPYPEKATIAGPCRVIPRELPQVTTSMIDVGKVAADKTALRLLEDLIAPPINMVAAIRGEKRFELEYRTQTLDVDTPNIRGDGTYLITGGFGGIGLTLAEDLIKQGASRIVLLSRSGLPDRADWVGHLKTHSPVDQTSTRIKAVQALETLGAEIVLCRADVCNITEMRDLARSLGAVHGVIHAAGVVDDAPILAKTPSSVEDVFTPKLHGTEVLHQVFPDGTLDWLVLFSSTSTATAPVGQVDYVAANAFLNAYAASRSNDKTRVLALNWGIWAEVGMAADALAQRDAALQSEAKPIDMPLLDDAGFDHAGQRQFHATYRVSDQWVLDGHRTKAGDALLPGTGYLELAAEALRAHGEDGPFSLNDLLFLRPLAVDDHARKEIRLKLHRSDFGYDIKVQSQSPVNGRKGWETHAEANVDLSSIDPPAPVNIAEVMERCPDVTDGLQKSPQEVHLNFGPRWSVLQKTAYGTNEGIARLALPDDLRSDIDAGFLLHPALMDIATGWAMKLIDGYTATHLWVPLSYGSVDVYRTLPDTVYSWVRNASHNTSQDETARFDIVITDEDGNICVEVSGFTLHRLGTNQSFAKPIPAKEQDLEFDITGAQQPQTAAEERLRHNLEQGIRPSEGAAAFRRALATGQSEIIVSSLNLNGLIAQADATVEKSSTGQSFQRPELDSDFIAPSNDIERTLAGFWQDLLGVEQVGVEDSFFDLGGHSLVAVRLFAMVKKAYQIDFPISILFEAPTITKCAALIADQVGGATNNGDTPTPLKKPTRRFTHIVPMHEGEAASKTPFFLVAGMFGNVLNLRHLAHLLGADRPFYGLQAKGLYGDDKPHDNIETAAADYIAEMQIVQPHGPYFLGGFSGGGITAYEIARQLREAGEETALLVMLDTPLPTRRPLERSDRMRIQWQELKRKGLSYPFVWLKNRIQWELQKRQSQPDAAIATHQFHNSDIEAAFLHAVATYSLRKWDGPVALFRPPLVGHWAGAQGRLISSERAYLFHDNDWGDWINTVDVIEVPGDHDSMVLEPNVRVLAAHMKRLISSAERKSTQTKVRAAE